MYLISSTDVPELYLGRKHAIRTDEPAISGSRPLNRVKEIVDVAADSVQEVQSGDCDVGSAVGECRGPSAGGSIPAVTVNCTFGAPSR